MGPTLGDVGQLRASVVVVNATLALTWGQPAEPIEAQPFRTEGKAVLPSSCQELLSCEYTSEKVEQPAALD